jgi:hypothetical protein
MAWLGEQNQTPCARGGKEEIVCCYCFAACAAAAARSWLGTRTGRWQLLFLFSLLAPLLLLADGGTTTLEGQSEAVDAELANERRRTHAG